MAFNIDKATDKEIEDKINEIKTYPYDKRTELLREIISYSTASDRSNIAKLSYMFDDEIQSLNS